MARTFNLADLFEVVAAAVPERTAFICGEQRLSLQRPRPACHPTCLGPASPRHWSR